MLKKALVYVEGKSSSAIQQDGKEIDVINNHKIEDLPNSVYDEIELLDVLEYDERDNILDIVVTKLRHQGIVKISGVDCFQVAKSFTNGEISMEVASGKLLNGRYKMCSVHALREKLEAQAFEIGLVAIAGFRYILEAKRP